MRLFLVPTIGSRIKDARNAKGWSQFDLGERVGTTQQTIGKIEVNPPGYSRFYNKIAEVLGVSYDWLMTGKKEPSSISLESDPSAIIEQSREALNESINAVKKIMIRKGVDPAVLDSDTTDMLIRAFTISLQGKLTGDYVTSALELNDINKKAG